MNYLNNVVVSASAKKEMKKVDKNTKKRIISAIERLRHIPPDGDIKSLKGKKGFLRCRVGDWRIIFVQDIENERLIIYHIASRGTVYKTYNCCISKKTYLLKSRCVFL